MEHLVSPPKRVLAIHDLSGFGRCSLTAITPVLSVMGVQVCPVPTAILSTHTGGLGDPVITDLTDSLLPALRHYQSLGLDFDCIYSGFLGDSRQIECCKAFFEAYPKALKVVDPVMGDHQKPYRTCTPPLRAKMKSLARTGDVITPNATEAAMLLGMDFTRPVRFTPLSAKKWLRTLCAQGAGRAVITSAEMDGGRYNLLFDGETFFRIRGRYASGSYPGTGDIFTAVPTGGLLAGQSLAEAAQRATQFVEEAISLTAAAGTDPRHGVLVEAALPKLLEPLGPSRAEPF